MIDLIGFDEQAGPRVILPKRHPIGAVYEIVRSVVAPNLQDSLLRVVAFIRQGPEKTPRFSYERDIRAEAAVPLRDYLTYQEEVLDRRDLFRLNCVDTFKEDVVGAARAAISRLVFLDNHDPVEHVAITKFHPTDKVEWGIGTMLSRDRGFLPAFDLAENVQATDLVAFRYKLRSLDVWGAMATPPDVKFYSTGNGHHAYCLSVMPANRWTQWLQALSQMVEADQKWVDMAKDDSARAVLRWSSGLPDKGRQLPDLVTLQ